MNKLETTLIWSLLRVFIVLLVIVPMAIYASRWYGRRQAPNAGLSIKAALSLGSNRFLYVVEWEGRRLLLGVTSQVITVLEQQVLEPQGENKREEAAD